jgi:hypothetical protein
MKIKSISCLGTALVLAATGAALASDTGTPQVTVSDMAAFPNGPELAGVSVLTRYNTSVAATVSTTGLLSNGAYSWWWVVFNHPEFCVDGCGLDDLPSGATPVSNGDPRVQASLLWGGGIVANGTGAAEMAAHLDRGKPPGEVRFGPGLQSSRKADIHIVLRTHGPALAGQVAEQIGSFNGGCAMAACANVQFAVHDAP